MALIDIGGIAKMAGCSIKNVRAWPSKYGHFPYPKQKVCGTGGRAKYLYDSEEIEAFLKNRKQERASISMSGSGFDLIWAVRFLSSSCRLWKQ